MIEAATSGRDVCWLRRGTNYTGANAMSRFVATCVVLACMAAAPAAASAASPSVVTDPATGIGNTSATLNGRVNPGGQIRQELTYFGAIHNPSPK